MERKAAMMKKPRSLKNGVFSTVNGCMIAMHPTTIDVINNAAPKSSPTAREPEWLFIAAKVENMSEEPLPRARKVAPAFQGSVVRRARV
jgi:hypothetical protein